MPTILLVLLITVLPSANLDKSSAPQVDRVERLAKQLHFHGEMTGEWTIIVTDFPTYQRIAKEGGKLGANMALTNQATKTTYISDDWLRWGVSDKELKFTLAHEAGHIICGCESEATADVIGHKLEQ